MDKAETYERSIGQCFMDISKWASMAVRILGYFPLTKKTEATERQGQVKTFWFTWSASVIPYFSCFLIMASLTWCFVYFWRYDEFKAFTDFKTPTEAMAFNLVIIVSILAGTYARLFGLLGGKMYEQFWQKTQLLLDQFPTDMKIERSFPPPEFQKIGNRCKLDFFLVLIPVIIHVLSFRLWATFRSSIDGIIYGSTSKFVSVDAQLDFGFGFWSAISMLHVWNGIWMNFFVKIYTECLHVIDGDLKRLKYFDNNQHQRNLYKPNGKSANSEMAHEQVKGFQTTLLEPRIYQRQPNSIDDSSLLPFPSGESPTSGSVFLKTILNKLSLVEREIARFNDFFGNLILFQVGNGVMYLLSFSFFGCMWMGRGQWDSCLETVIPLYLFAKELLDMGKVAEKLSAAADDVLNSLSDVVFDHLTEELYLKIQLTSIQLCSKPPVISARQFFTINRSLVASIGSALATFLVVLVQFRDQDDEDAKQLEAGRAVTTMKPGISTILNSSSG